MMTLYNIILLVILYALVVTWVSILTRRSSRKSKEARLDHMMEGLKIFPRLIELPSSYFCSPLEGRITVHIFSKSSWIWHSLCGCGPAATFDVDRDHDICSSFHICKKCLRYALYRGIIEIIYLKGGGVKKWKR